MKPASLDVVLTRFKPLSPGPLLPQERVLRLLTRLYTVGALVQEGATSRQEIERIGAEVAAKMERYGISPEIIATRYFCILPDAFANDEPEDVTPHLFEDLAKDGNGALLPKRLAWYRDYVGNVLTNTYPQGCRAPDDILHVTCTGYMLPNPVQNLVSERGWTETMVTNSYHMGCYGAFPAIRIAAGLHALSRFGVARAKACIDVVHTEMIASQLDLARQTPASFVTATLFGDGFIRYSAVSEGAFDAADGHGLRVLALDEMIVPESGRDMTLDIGTHAFNMTLSRGVPRILERNIQSFVKRLLGHAGCRFEDVRDDLIYAVHPGGTRIIGAIQKGLGLDPAQVQRSHVNLRRYGNMASASIPYLWAEIVADTSIPVGSKILSLGFGPGLTAAGLLLEKV